MKSSFILKTALQISIASFAIFFSAVVFLNLTNQEKILEKKSAQIPKQEEPTQPVQPVDLWSELPKHNLRSDCWIAYSGHLYDITPYFGSHPGGDKALLKYCGGDATTAFNTKDKNPPKSHSKKAGELLEGYRID